MNDFLAPSHHVGPTGEAAEYLHNCFTVVGLSDVERDRGLWAWLSLFYIDAVCPQGRSGERNG